MRDVNLVKENISKMIELNAPESDIDQYVASEGYTPEMLRGGQDAPPQPSQDPVATPTQATPAQDEPMARRLLKPAAQFAMGVPQGLGNAAVGAFQAATDVGEKAASLIEKLYYGDNVGQQTFGNRLAERVKQDRAQQTQLPTAERVGIMAGEIAPYLTTGAGTGAKVAAMTGSKVAGLAAGAGVGGAVSGALSPQETTGLENRIGEGVKQGLTGVAFGTTLGAGMKIAGGVSKAGKALFTAKTPEDILAARLPKEQTVALLEQLKTATPDNPVLLPDIAGDSIKGLTRSVAKIPVARDIVTDALEKRSEGAVSRVTDYLSKDISPVDAYFGNLDDLSKARSDASKPLYEKVFGTGPLESIDAKYAKKMDDLLGRPAKQGVQTEGDVNAFTNAKDSLLKEWKAARSKQSPGAILPSKGNEELLSKIAPELKTVRSDFRLSPEEAPDNSFALLHHVKESLFDKAQVLKRQGANSQARVYDNLRAELTKKMGEASPDYKKANEVFGSFSQLKGAQEAGIDFSKLRPEEIRREMLGMNAGERDAYRIGVREGLQKVVSSTADGADPAKRIFGNEFKREQIKAVFGNESKFSEFEKKIATEIRAADTKAKVLGGSRSDYNMAGDEEFLGKVIGGMKDAARAKTNPLYLLEATYNAISNKFAGINKGNAEAIANSLVNRRETIKTLENIIKREKNPIQKRVVLEAKDFITANLLNNMSNGNDAEASDMKGKIAEQIKQEILQQKEKYPMLSSPADDGNLDKYSESVQQRYYR